MNLSIELIPRNPEALSGQLGTFRRFKNHFTHINIPDLMKFPLRSWEACALAQGDCPNTIPHFRAIDFDVTKPAPLFSILERYAFKEVLVVKGDKPQDMSRDTFDTDSIDLIRIIKKNFPEILTYGAFDPYRSGMQSEIHYLRQKFEAGCDGVFTQPFFDSRLLEIYSELLSGFKVFWGMSPVVTEKSMSYWMATNKAYFPKDFDLSLEWNVSFFKRTQKLCLEKGFDMYLMPIRIQLDQFLDTLFGQEETGQ